MKKLIFFDLDGTLIAGNSWFDFNLAFGMSEQEDSVLFDWYKRGLITYDEWDSFITRILRDKNICTREKVAEFANTLTPRPDAQTVIDACKAAGYTPALLSGTMEQIAKPIAEKLGIELCYTTSTIVFRDDGTFEDIANDKDEAPAKLRIFERICAEHGADPLETIHVGDGGNDLEIFKKSKRGILLGTYEQLRPHAWKQISELKEVIGLI